MNNLLFITIDDYFSLSAWPMYKDIVVSPNLDALAANSANFEAAFSDVAVCNPSRAAILTGQTPWQTGVVSNKQALHEYVNIETDTLPAILKAAGMHTAIGGKVFHDFRGEDQTIVSDEVLDSTGLRYSQAPEFNYVGNVRFGATEQVMADDVLTDNAGQFLENYDGASPFALFLGIFRPHTDWIVPQEYIDLYADIDIPIPDNIDELNRAPFMRGGRLDFHNKVLDAFAWEALVKHYLASVSYADAKLGEIMDALAASGHGDDTITMVMSDHGYHLGDAQLWHKFTTYDQSSRVPLMISVPGEEAQTITTPVNLSNVAATALDLLGIDVPAQMQPSLKPFLDGQAATGDEFAVTWVHGSVSIRTAEYRYSRYENGNEELYDVNADVMNNNNLIYVMPEVVAEMRVLADAQIGDDLFIRPEGPVFGTEANSAYYLSLDPVEIQDAGGRDIIYVSVDYTLPEGIENLEAVGLGEGLVLTGNDLDNRIAGTQVADTLFGLGGNDILTGEWGNDVMYGGDGNDTLYGSAEDDDLYGDDGDDYLLGEADKDRLWGGAGNDVLDGGSGNDLLRGGAGNDWLDGNANTDRIEGGPGDDVLIGGHGWDQLTGGGGIDTALFSGNRADYVVYSGTRQDFLIEGIDGRDLVNSMEQLQFDDILMTVDEFFLPDTALVLRGGAGADTIVSNSGEDRLFGGRGNDTLRARSNDDVLHGGLGADILDGGFGNDTASYDGASGGVQVSLMTGIATGAFGNDQLISIENLLGADFNDTLHGDHSDNRIEGGHGNDLLVGNDGNDVLIGSRGRDRLEGGEGDDTLTGNFGQDTIFGGAGDDTIRGGTEVDVLHGGSGSDFMAGDDGDDIFWAGSGDDRLFGGNGADSMRAGGGDDQLTAGNGDDSLYGEDGHDVLNGGRGDDLLFGGAGDDEMTGGAGFDTFFFSLGHDVITDFEVGDSIYLSASLGVDSLADVLAVAQSVNAGSDVLITFAPETTLLLEGLALADLTEASFAF